MTLSLKNVSRVVQGEQHLDNINIVFERGSFNVLLGRTLAGKTSLMRLIAGLDQPSTGSIIMDGVDVTGVPVQKRKISMVYQQFINYPNLSVFENIASPLRIASESEASIKGKVESIAELLHIEDFLQRKPLELSGGQQQRTAMARALVKDSDIVLFDEPLVNLDYKLREELRFELRELFKQQNVIAVYASTEPAEALALGGVTTLLHEGKIIQSGLVNEVYTKPDRIEVAELFSEPPINILPGAVSQTLVTLENGVEFKLPERSSLSDGQYRFGLRPHHLKLTSTDLCDVALNLEVTVAEISGSETYLHTTDGVLELVAQFSGVQLFSPGAKTTVYFSPQKLIVFDLQGTTVENLSERISSSSSVELESIQDVSND